MRALLCLAAVAGLSACGGAGLKLPETSDDKAVGSVTVTRGKVTLTGPTGFCVDPENANQTPESAFVVFGNCAAITGTSNASRPPVNAIVTTTVRMADPSVPKIDQSAQQLASFFDSNAGHILLSRDNTSESVSVNESGATEDGAFFLHITDASAGIPQGASNTYWRSYFDIKNTLVTVSVLSLNTTPLTRDEGLDLLRTFTSMVQQNPGNVTAKRPVAAATIQTPASSGDTQIKPIIRPDGEIADEVSST
ncbi:MAG: hypothetical protein ABJ327_23455 [Litoreibacter sp.]